MPWAVPFPNVVKFGRLLNQSGRSALDLYGLAENTPELRYLLESAQNLDGVLGTRNMGGGFSAIILALVKNKSLTAFRLQLQNQYQQKFSGSLEFVRFTPSQGVKLLL